MHHRDGASDDSDAIEHLKIDVELLCVIRSAVWEAMCLLSRITGSRNLHYIQRANVAYLELLDMN